MVSRALTVMTDPVRRAEAYWVLTRAQVSAGRSDDAIATMRLALASADLPERQARECRPGWLCCSGPRPAIWTRPTRPRSRR